MKYIKDQENLEGKIVLLRLDLNVPLKNRVITDETRINKILPVINFLIKKKIQNFNNLTCWATKRKDKFRSIFKTNLQKFREKD